MKQLFTLIFLFLLGVVWGQKFSYPSIKKQGSTVADFVPQGWKILDSASGDLNKDKLVDFAVILQHKDGIKILKSEEGDSETVTTQPRMLIILFRCNSSNKYMLKEQNNSFILNNDNSTMEEPYQSIKIINGALRLDFQLFSNMGSWFITSSSYIFRYQNNDFFLIGAEYKSFNRANQDYEDYSYNFSTKEWSLTTGNESSNTKPKVEWHKLDLKVLKTFSTFKKPFTWEVTKDIYL